MVKNLETLLDNVGKIAYTLDKAYISNLSSYYGVLRFDERYNSEQVITYPSNIRTLKVERWVFDEDEKPGDCFKNVLNLFADGENTVALVVNRTSSNTEMYFVIKNEGEGKNEYSRSNIELLNGSLQGNFPGTNTKIIDDINKTKELFKFSKARSIAVLVNNPSEKSEDFITQGLDKLLNGIVPENESENYSVIFLAESLTQENIREILSGYEDMATSINPFLEYQFQVGEERTDTSGEMHSTSNTKGTSESVFKTHSINIGINGNSSKGTTKSWTGGFSISSSKLFKGLIDIGAGVTRTVAKTAIKGLGISGGYGYSWGKSKTDFDEKTTTKGASTSISLSESENTSYTYKSYMVSNLINKLEKTMARINESQATGLWKYSTYVLAEDAKTSINVANYLRSVTQGEESYVEPSFIQYWNYEESKEPTAFGEIKDYISHFTHPIFMIGHQENNEIGRDKAIMLVTPTSYVGTDKLSHVIAFPKKSLQGLPVLNCVRFGREPHTLIEADRDLELGYGYHMHQKIESQRIKISKEELTKHTFITGSTGAGKSNTIYNLLKNLGDQDIKFLVIEPAKGEYKTILGKKKDVTVYGTNPKLKDIRMLRINPFRFPEKIHVLEHIDRLVEIFNVCWPMYAAMPAILKDSIERAYIYAGWDLASSENKYDNNLFPTFADVLVQIKKVLEESEYSADNKSDYTGALVTRVRSLTNGINGLIFTTNDISDVQLFDENVIVDLSRIGSTETKALIMGLLVLKLQEHRMDSTEPNMPLHHVTVLEEAHNLLRRTSTEQIGEIANLVGKSVEMLANSIAEMRTYGEGFIIADQSPGLLDMSVIRNTNTKIIFRLPDYTDRKLIGKAAGLNEKQIIELGRLEKGVASITQSDWLEPVLCKLDKYEVKNVIYDESDDNKDPNDKIHTIENEVKESLLEWIMNRAIYRKIDKTEIEGLQDMVIRSKLDTKIKCQFLNLLNATEKDDMIKLSQRFTYDFLDAGSAVEVSRGYRDIVSWAQNVADELQHPVKDYSRQQTNLLLALIVGEQVERDISYSDLYCRFTEMYRERGYVI